MEEWSELIAVHAPEKIPAVPNQPSYGRRKRGLLFWDDDFESSKYATEKMGSSPNPQFEEFLAWFMRRPGAELPERPTQELIDEADAYWAERKARIRERALSIKCPSCGVERGLCMRGKGKGKHPTEEIHMPRVIKATKELDSEAKGQAEDSAASADE
ncbi:hypothetical protein E1264_39995 [Actinomadura sp. KC216]|uniref:hypothetical protein n=1 Tax=Actinomadura sp. KC216 TaxID=2530370 RepID=UPI0010531BA8|nr:hypothetical protein [Actinomadura sp. KC216]TDB75338.1 hypothetical protein E1264_39995 [Actinomadura sp. KC216]